MACSVKSREVSRVGGECVGGGGGSEGRRGDQRDRHQSTRSDGPWKTTSFTLLELETIGGFEGQGQADLHLNLVSGAAVLRMNGHGQGEKPGHISEEANAVI